MNNLYEALDICLRDIEQGADLESVLFRYPDLADELRPILEASAGAKRMAAPMPSVDVVRRNRAKVLQHAAQMRESKVRSSQRIWFASLRRIAVTLVVVVALFVSGTGLVRAASTTLPGDNLYPVKRTWEDVLLLFTFNLQEREALEVEHENERLHELKELFTVGRSAEVDFAGAVTSQNGDEWVVNGVRVVISGQTEVRDGPITLGSAVRVHGLTQGKGIVLAERIRVLSSDEKLPEVEYQDEDDDENGNEGSSHPSEDNSGPGSGNESPSVEETETPESGSGSGDESSKSGSDNENSGSEGVSNENNENSSRDNNDNGGDDNSGSNDGSHDNSNDNSNEDSSHDSNSNDNGDHSGGGEDNSGSGGGGDDGGND